MVATPVSALETPPVQPATKPVITVSVRELVEFVLRTGGLGRGTEFVGSNRALAGTRGHQQVQRSRPEGYQKEVRLLYEIVTNDLTLRVQGRIDGVLTTGASVLLEEIKTTQGHWDGTPDPLHWAQAKIYGFIYSDRHGLSQITLRLCYLSLETGASTELDAPFAHPELKEFFDSATRIYLEWVQARHAWQRKRDASIRTLGFPFPAYRPGQREIAVAVYRAVQREQRLFLEAPTGIGKTMAVFFPAIKALGTGAVDRLFYLTARNTAQAIAEKALTELREQGLKLRSVTLTAKEKLCQREGLPCDLELCPLAQGYYDRRHRAIREALELEHVNRPVLEQLAAQHQVCPFELALDTSQWVDAVVCDYNYVFDPQAFLRRHFEDARADCVFLIDEAHNLVDRGREMFSAEITLPEINEVRKAIQHTLPRCARALSNLGAGMRKLAAQDSPAELPDSEPAEVELAFINSPTPSLPRTATEQALPRKWNGPGSENQALVFHPFPPKLKPLLEAAVQQAEVWLARNEPAEFRAALLELYFRLSAFRRTAERYGAQDRTLLTLGAPKRLRIYCLDPSSLLRPALDRGKASIFFSGTLSPMGYFRDLLGGENGDPALQFASPFPPENLGVLMHDAIRTDYISREATLDRVAGIVGALVALRVGNYLVYLPSYKYLTALVGAFVRQHPDTRVLVQRPGMTDRERTEFLNAFATKPRESQVGFAVLGGVFGEGIDLMGDRLIAAVIVGVGLPQLSMERDLIREHFEEKLGAGFDYAYRFPGINRVLQATGRVIRSETDRGLVLLVDARFGEPRYRRLFPKWWQPARVRSEEQIHARVVPFWSGKGTSESTAS